MALVWRTDFVRGDLARIFGEDDVVFKQNCWTALAGLYFTVTCLSHSDRHLRFWNVTHSRIGGKYTSYRTVPAEDPSEAVSSVILVDPPFRAFLSVSSFSVSALLSEEACSL